MGKLLGNKLLLGGVGGIVVIGALFYFVLQPMLFGGGSDEASADDATTATSADSEHGGESVAVDEGDHGEEAGSTDGEGDAHGEDEAEGEGGHQKPGPTVRLPDRIHNLFGTPRHYVKLGIALEFEAEDPKFYELAGEARVEAEEEFALEVGPMIPLIEDTITAVIGGKSIEQISTPAGREALKREVLLALRGVVAEPHLNQIYFTEFLTQ